MKLVAVDVGASSGRTMLGTIDKDRIVLQEIYRFPNAMVSINESKHWDVERLIREIKKGIPNDSTIRGIGIDTWGVDYGLLDQSKQLIGMPFAYRDKRNEAAMPKVYQIIRKEDLYRRTGIQEMPFNTIFQLMAEFTTFPERKKSAQYLLFMPELLTWMLTGTIHNEYTIASTSGLLDAKKRDWDYELIDHLGYPRHLFRPLHQPGTRVGDYQGIPVFLVPSHDTASAVVAVPVTEDRGDWAYLSSGTWSLIGVELSEPILSPEAARADLTNEGGAGKTIRFLKNVQGLWLIQECRRIWSEQGIKLTYDEIDAAAEASQFTGVINPNDLRFMAPKNMVEEIASALQESGQPIPKTVGDYARCCYMSLAKAYAKQIREIEKVTGRTIRRLHIVGGGSQVKILNQLTANETRLTVFCGPVEATTLGNLGFQAIAAGVFQNISELRRAIANSFPIHRYDPQ